MPRRFSYWFVGTLVAWFFYTIVWTWISLERLYVLRASVLDLGIYAQLGWRTYSIPLSPGEWLGTALNLGGSIFLSPTTLGGYPTILAAQSLALGSGAVLVYLVARHYEHRPPVAFGLSAAYLLYFPLAGINFSDAHFQAYLIPFFLLGIWLYLRGSFVLSFAFLLLAGAIQFPLGVFPLLFGIQLLVPEVSQSIASRMEAADPGGFPRRRIVPLFRKLAGWKFTRSGSPAPKWYVYGLPLAAAVLLVGAWLTSDLYTTNYTVVRLAHASSIGILPNLADKFWSLFFLLVPLAFLPFLSPRWLPFCVPFFALMFCVNYFAYTYPYIATSWYPFLVVPFLFLATIDGAAKIREGSTWVHSLGRKLHWTSSHRLPRKTRSEAAETGNSHKGRRAWRQSFAGRASSPSAVSVSAVVVLTAVSACFFTPYGPWNASTDANFNFPVLGPVNRTLYNELVKLASFIPPSDSSVLMQNNMPELLPRPTPPGSLPPFVVGPFPVVAYNLTWQTPNGSWSPINPDYVIADPTMSPYGFFALAGAYPYNLSMQDAVTRLFATYDYGILGEASGMILLKHYYSGPIQYYVPYVGDFSAGEFYSSFSEGGNSFCGSSCLVTSHLTGQQTAWYSPYTFLSPGTYVVSFHVGLANWAPDDHVLLQVAGENYRVRLNSTLISGLTVGPGGASRWVNITVFAGGGIRNVAFGAVDSSFNGTLALYDVKVREVAPPSPLFLVGDTANDAAIYHLLSLVPMGSTVLGEPALRPYFHNLTLVSVSPGGGAVPPAQYELYDPSIPSLCAGVGNSTLCTAVNSSYVSEKYGIVAQDDGVTLLRATSAPSLGLFAPLSENISTSQLMTQGAPGQEYTTPSPTGVSVTNQTNGGYAWFGPYASLPPGSYEATFDLSTTNTSPRNHVTLGVVTENGSVLASSLTLPGSLFASVDQVANVTVSATLFSFSSTVEFVAYGVNWSGTLTLHSLGVREVAPPSPVFRVGDTVHDLAVYRLLGLIPNGSRVLAEPALGVFFHNLTLVPAPLGSSSPPPYELYDPTIPSSCSAPNNGTLCAAISSSYASGAYAIVAQDDGVTLLARSPAPPLSVFAPLLDNVSTAQLITSGTQGQNYTASSGGHLTVTNQTNGDFAWYGPYASFAPGVYEAQFDLTVSNNSPLNRLELRITGELGTEWLGALNLTGGSFDQEGRTVLLNVSFTLTGFSSSVEFDGCEFDWEGVVTLSQLVVTETGPPGSG